MIIQSTRTAWLCVVLSVILLSCCGVRSTGDSKGSDAPTPVYASDKKTVYDAARRVLKTKFKRIDEQDPTHYKVVGTETNWPGGDTRIEVTIRDASAGHVAVDVKAESQATSSPGWNKTDRDFRNFLTWLDAEMKNPTTEPADSSEDRLKELDRLHSQGLITDDEYKAKRSSILEHL